jgi:hypothetical protein
MLPDCAHVEKFVASLLYPIHATSVTIGFSLKRGSMHYAVDMMIPPQKIHYRINLVRAIFCSSQGA